MKADEFIKKHGLEKASAELNVFQSELAVNFGWDFVGELKRLVESHELVESYGGLEKSRKHLNEKCVFEWTALDGKLSQAICDVESCL